MIKIQGSQFWCQHVGLSVLTVTTLLFICVFLMLTKQLNVFLFLVVDMVADQVGNLRSSVMVLQEELTSLNSPKSKSLGERMPVAFFL